MVAISETWLTEEDHIPISVSESFSIHRVDREGRTQGGGAAILVRKDIPHLRLDSRVGTHNIQMCAVALLSNNNKATIATVYRSPGANLDEDRRLVHALDELAKSPRRLIIIGDFNFPSINWVTESCLQDTAEEGFLTWFHSRALLQHVNVNTRFRGEQQPSLLDLVITRHQRDIETVSYLPPIGKSDHLVIKAILSTKMAKTPTVKSRNFGAMDIARLISTALDLEWHVTSEHVTVEDRWQLIKRNLQDLQEEVAPLRNRRERGKPPWWRPAISRAIRNRDRCWRHYQKAGTQLSWFRYTQQRNQSISLIRARKRKYELFLASKIKQQPKRYYNIQPTRPLPLSLLAYRTACLSLQLNVCAFPQASTEEWISWQQNPVLFSNSVSLSNLMNAVSTTRTGSEPSTLQPTVSGNGSKRLAQLRRHVTPKKAHEIDRHAAVICSVARAISNGSAEFSTTTAEPLIIDVGSGQGHLARRLCLHHGLKVLNLELDEGHLQKASQFDAQIKSYLEKKAQILDDNNSSTDTSIQFRSPWSFPLRITSTTTSSELLNVVSQIECGVSSGSWTLFTSSADDESLCTTRNRPPPPPPILLNGLHTCGDLSTTILRLFTELDCALGVVTVGCCYMKGTTTVPQELQPTTDRGSRQCPHALQKLWEPQSRALRPFSVELSYAMLEAACHSIGDYMRRLRLAVDTGSVTHLHVHGYRALLELLLKRRSDRSGSNEAPSTRAIRCSVKHTNNMDFNTYSRRLLDRMAQVQKPASVAHQKLFAPFTEAEVNHALATIGPNQTPNSLWPPVVRYHVFRLMLTPVVETVLLLDRLLHMQEQGFSACLLRVFDYTISPRNLAVIALRDRQKADDSILYPE